MKKKSFEQTHVSIKAGGRGAAHDLCGFVPRTSNLMLPVLGRNKHKTGLYKVSEFILMPFGVPNIHGSPIRSNRRLLSVIPVTGICRCYLSPDVCH